jgi:hypothetical protein
MSTTEAYFKPVNVNSIKLHGDYTYDFPNQSATVVRVFDLTHKTHPPVVTCKDPEAWLKVTGIEHTPEAYIRSYLMLFKGGLEYDVHTLNWNSYNDLCKQAYAENQQREDLPMTYEYDTGMDMFDISITKHYEFDLPEEMLLLLPVDLLESEYVALEHYPEAYQAVISQLAWRYLITTLPITNIREVDNA